MTSIDIFRELGVKPFINARGPYTRLGGAPMLPVVVEAMRQAAEATVHLDEMQDAVGARIAALTRNEAAMVTSGASGGIVLAVAACMTGGDPDKMGRLPNAAGMKNQVIMQRRSRFDEDFAVTQAGAQLVLVDSEAELRSAVSEQTAAVFVTTWVGNGLIPLKDVIGCAQAKRVPVIVDAACEVPPPQNLWKFTTEMGCDVALFSGGKGLQGPQGSGLALGRREIIAAMKAQACPRCLIGRPMKVTKEEMAGLYAAVKWLLESPPGERDAFLHASMGEIERRLAAAGSQLRFKRDGDVLELCWNEADMGLKVKDVVARLRAGSPSIEASWGAGLRLNLSTLRPGQAEVVASRLAEALEL